MKPTGELLREAARAAEQGAKALELLEQVLDRWGSDVDDTDQSIDGADCVEWLVDFVQDVQELLRRPGFKDLLSLEKGKHMAMSKTQVMNWLKTLPRGAAVVIKSHAKIRGGKHGRRRHS